MTAEAIRIHEQAVLQSLSWQINLPSVHTWLSMLRDRFNILSCRICSQSIDFAFASSTSIAGTLVMHNVVSTSMSPQRMANGLFCLTMVVVNLIPLEALRPVGLCTAEGWTKLYIQNFAPSGGAVSMCKNSAHLGDMLRLIQAVAWSGLATLQGDSHAVAMAMRKFASSLQSRHAQGAKRDT